MGHQLAKNLGTIVHDDGVDFAVWAPFAKKVSLLFWAEFAWEEYPMRADGEGYWFIEDFPAEPGQMYKYRITTADGRVLDKNDPYARQVIDSVEGGSSVIVARDFEWEGAEKFKPAPHNETIIYELHVGTFNKPDASTTGTFDTVIEKLDYLKDLGITHIELMPVTTMAMGHGWGYAPNHIFSIEQSYGGRRGMLELVKACHEKGIAVIVDVVYNHFYGSGGLWQFDGWSENNRGGIYFYNDERGDTPWGGRPDYGRAEVRKFILDNVAMWFSEFKVDGLRLDSTIYMRNSDGNNDKHELDIPDAWTLLTDINKLAHKINPHALMIAEDNSTNDKIVQPVNKGGMGFDAQWEVGFPHVIREGLGINSDQRKPSLQGIEYELAHTYRGDAFDKVIFGDSHDTAANGSQRLNEAVTPGNAESALARSHTILASAIALTAPGIPMLLQGQEFMQEGAFNEWKMLEWGKAEQFSGIVLAHQHIISLRKNIYGNTRGLIGQNTSLLQKDESNNVFAYHRWDKGGPKDDTLIFVNISKDRFDDYKVKFPVAGTWIVRFNSCWNGYSSDFYDMPMEKVQTDADGNCSIKLSSLSVVILSRD